MMQPDTSLSLTANESKFVLSVLGLVTCIFLWAIKVALRVFFEMRDTLRDAKHALWGDPKAQPPNGVLRKFTEHVERVTQLGDDFKTHVETEEQWQREMYRAVHDWNETAQAALAHATSVPPPQLEVPPPPERRKRSR